MLVLETYGDGSQTILFEVGDRVRLNQVSGSDQWLAKPGEIATVTRRRCPRDRSPSSIDHLEVRTDLMDAGKWGSISVPPWFVELVADIRQSENSPQEIE